MRLILILILWFSIIDSKGQTDWIELPIENSIWSDFYIALMSGPPEFEATYHYSYGGDTLINDKVFKKIIEGFDQNNYVGALREEDKKVYFIKGFTEDVKIIYDFNIEVGTVIDSVQTLSEDCYDSNCSYFKLMEKDTTGDRTRYEFGFYYEDENAEEVFVEHAFSWIEGIGSTFGLFNDLSLYYGNFYISATTTNYHELLCFRTDNNLIYTGDYYIGECTRPFIVDKNIEEELEVEILVFPNPTKGEINIIPNDKEFELNKLSYLIQDMYGRDIEPIRSIEELRGGKLDISNQSSGLYYLQITDGEKRKIWKIMKI